MNPPLSDIGAMSTSRSGSATPAGSRRSRRFATLKTVVLAPMPMASDSAAVNAKIGLRRSSRAP